MEDLSHHFKTEGERVEAEMRRQGLDRKSLAELAQVDPRVVTKIIRGEESRLLPQVRRALGLAAGASAEVENLPQDVRLIRDAVAIWLSGVAPERRATYVAHLFAAITASADKGDES